MVRSIRCFSTLLVICSFFLISNAVADSFTASLSHNPIAINDTLQLTLRFEGQRPSDEPNLDPLKKDFTVAGVSQDQRVQIINGRYSGAYSWHVSLQAKNIGTFEIPAIKLGQYETKPIKLVVTEEKVTPGQANRISISVTADKAKAYVGEQILLTLSMKRRADVQSGGLKLSEPFDYEQLGDARDYSSVEKGIRYFNSELKLVVFSDKAGTLKIPSIFYEGKVPSTNNRRRPNFSSFFNNYSTITARSKPLAIEVAAKPQSAPVNWLPSRGLTISESWETDTMAFKQGQPVTWTIRVQAEGLKHESLPNLDMPEIDGIKWYPDQPQGESQKTDSGIVSVKTYKYALVPDKVGNIVLPRIQIPWWNIESDASELAVLESRTIQVQASANSSNPGTTTAMQPSSPRGQNNSTDTDGSIMLPPSSGNTAVFTSDSSNHWKLVSIMLLVLWLVTLLFFALPAWRQRRYQAQSMEDANFSKRANKKSVQRACARGDKQQIKLTLLRWGQALPNTPRKLLNLSQLADAINDEALKKELLLLDKALYSESSNWQSDNLLAAIERYDSALPTQDAIANPTGVILNPSL